MTLLLFSVVTFMTKLVDYPNLHYPNYYIYILFLFLFFVVCFFDLK